MYHLAQSLKVRQSAGERRRRADRLARRALSSGRTPRPAIRFERAAASPGDADVHAERRIHSDLDQREQRMRRLGWSRRRIAAAILRTAESLRAIQRAASIRRCSYVHEPDRERRNPAPCGGRLQRQGGLLTCQQCGRTANG